MSATSIVFLITYPRKGQQGFGMIARIVFRLGLAACFAGAAPLAMAQDVAKPDAPASAPLDAAPAQMNAPSSNVTQDAAKPDAPAGAALDEAPAK